MRRWEGLLLAIAAVTALFAAIGFFGGQDVKFIPASRPAGTAHAGLAAVVMSGDMGLDFGMGGQITNDFAADGIPVIAINSLSFFRYRRTPAEVATLIDTVTRQALALPGIDRVVLIGQSFGADMLPYGLASMPRALRARVAMVGLVVPGDTATFRASPSEIFSWSEPEVDAVPVAQGLTWVPAVCIRGREEARSLCPALTQPNMRQAVLPGGHPLRRNASAVYKVLIANIDASTAGATP